MQAGNSVRRRAAVIWKIAQPAQLSLNSRQGCRLLAEYLRSRLGRLWRRKAFHSHKEAAAYKANLEAQRQLLSVRHLIN